MQLVGLNRLGISRPMRSSVKFDFSAGVLPPGVAFSRASAGEYFNASRALTQAASDVPRFDYSYATGAALGLRLEEAQTNGIRNSTMAGAVAGTPGTLPTNWSFGSLAGLTRQIVGVGTVDGMEYIDIRVSGTTSGTGGYLAIFDATTAIASAQGQTWIESCYLALVGGSLANITLLGFDAVSYPGGNDNTGTDIKASLTGSLQRFYFALAIPNVGNANIQPRVTFNCTNGAAVDFTLRYARPMMVQASVLGRPIGTSSVAVTRARDVCTITDPAALTYPVWIVRGRTPIGPSTTGRTIFSIDDGSTQNARVIYRTGTNMQFYVVNGGAAQCALNLGSIADDTDFCIAARAMDNGFAASINGGAVVTDNVGTVPLGMTRAFVGNWNGSAEGWTSTIKSIELWRRATDAELQLLSV